MGMLMRRHYSNTVNNTETISPSIQHMAAGATEQVAPKPLSVEEKAEIKEDKPEEKKITRAEIQKMNVATVRAYAESQGIEGANEKSGAELKRILFDKLFEESE